MFFAELLAFFEMITCTILIVFYASEMNDWLIMGFIDLTHLSKLTLIGLLFVTYKLI